MSILAERKYPLRKRFKYDATEYMSEDSSDDEDITYSPSEEEDDEEGINFIFH